MRSWTKKVLGRFLFKAHQIPSREAAFLGKPRHPFISGLVGFFIRRTPAMNDYKVAELVDLLGDADDQEAGLILEMLEEAVMA